MSTSALAAVATIDTVAKVGASQESASLATGKSSKEGSLQHNYEKSEQEYENSSKTLTPTLLLGRHTPQKQTEAKCIQETSRPVAPPIWAIS